MTSTSSGQWSSNEHILFEKACVLFGWGRWKDITNWMESQGCGRSRDQVKSHAQKFAQTRPKRIDMMIHNNPRQEKRTPSKMTTEKEIVLTPMTASMATALMNLKHTFVSTPNIFSP